MLNKIIYYSLHNRLVVLVCALLLMIWGTYTAFNTDVDVFPDLNAPTVVIMTEANGMAPEEVEKTVTPAILPKKGLLEGITITYSVSKCDEIGCPNYGLCHPVGKTEGSKYSVAKMGKDVECPRGDRLVAVVVAGFAYDRGLDDPAASALYRWRGAGGGNRWRYQGVPNFVGAGTHEALRHHLGRRDDGLPEHEPERQRWRVV